MRQRFQQLPLPSRKGYDVISGASCVADIRGQVVDAWKCQKLLVVVSRSLVHQHLPGLVDELRSALPEGTLVSVKIGVGPHSPYADVLDIARRIQALDVDCVVCIGSGSYSDACKVATVLAETLPAGKRKQEQEQEQELKEDGDEDGQEGGPTAELDEEGIESLVDSATGLAMPDSLACPRARLVCVPTSLSAGEYNAIGACTSPQGKKQHFWRDEAAPRLILLDPEVTRHTPAHLWLCSGVRAVDHAVEVMCNPRCPPEAAEAQKEALRALLRGLRTYRALRAGGMAGGACGCESSHHRRQGDGHDADRHRHRHSDASSLALHESILLCQSGSRQAMCAALRWRVGFGLSHAIGHQLGSVAGVDHGVTSCILLPRVLAYTGAAAAAAQEEVLHIFNEACGWAAREQEAAGAVQRFVRELGMPTRLADVGVVDPVVIRQVAQKTLSDATSAERKMPPLEDILGILNSAR